MANIIIKILVQPPGRLRPRLRAWRTELGGGLRGVWWLRDGRGRGDAGVRSCQHPYSDGVDALGIVGRAAIGWSGHERAARAAFCWQDDMNTNEKAGSTTGWTTLLLDCGVSADTIRQTDDAEHWP